MTPLDAIVWTCVAVFAATASITLLHLCGFTFLRIPREFVPQLVKILIVQIATAGAGAFGYYTYREVRQPAKDALPSDDLIVVEQADAVVVYDGTAPLWARSDDVLLCRNDKNGKCVEQYAAVKFSRNRAMTNASELKLSIREQKTFKLDDSTYKASIRLIGKLAPDPRERLATGHDFVMLHIERN